MRNRVKSILVSLSAVLVLVAGTVVGTNLVTAEPASIPAVTVTFNYNGATGGNSVTTATVTSGTAADAELPHPTKPGVTFSGWFSTQSLLNGQRITTIEENDEGELIAGFIPPELAQTLNLVLPPAPCAQGGTCVLGNIGPGGGLVFYIDSSSGLRYEMAPKTWRGSSSDDTPLLKWCDSNTPVPLAVGIAVGTGAANTAAMADPTEGCASSPAATAALAYPGTNGSAGQWFLPSQDELNAMYTYSRVSGFDTVTYGFVEDRYWSSSQGTTSFAWWQRFSTGIQNVDEKDRTLRVRPVRAF